MCVCVEVLKAYAQTLTQSALHEGVRGAAPSGRRADEITETCGRELRATEGKKRT